MWTAHGQFHDILSVANLFLYHRSSRSQRRSQHFSLKMHSTLHSTSSRKFISFLAQLMKVSSHRTDGAGESSCRHAAETLFSIFWPWRSHRYSISLSVPRQFPLLVVFAHLKLLQIAIGRLMNYSRGFEFKNYISIFSLEGWIILKYHPTNVFS